LVLVESAKIFSIAYQSPSLSTVFSSVVLVEVSVEMNFLLVSVVAISLFSEILGQEWIPMDPSKSIPPNAVVGGSENSENFKALLYVGRKQIDNELVVGKVIDAWKSGYCELRNLELRSNMQSSLLSLLYFCDVSQLPKTELNIGLINMKFSP
jgi:hypothetical protein